MIRKNDRNLLQWICENVVDFEDENDKRPIQNQISGGDLDGDIYWVCWENSFLKRFQTKVSRLLLLQSLTKTIFSI